MTKNSEILAWVVNCIAYKIFSHYYPHTFIKQYVYRRTQLKWYIY